MKTIQPNTLHSEIVLPKPEQLASAVGNHGVDVVSTPSLILFFEAAANNLALPYYEANEISVGTHVNIDHVAAANGIDAITIEAKLTRQSGRRLEFALTAKQNETLIMQGEHHRAVMLREKFSSHSEKSTPTPKTIDFWFDFHSPWCYLAAQRIGGIAQEFNAQLNWRPLHLANLISTIGGGQPLQGDKAFVAWYEQDQRDFARLQGLPFEPHRQYPKRPSRALRAAIYASDQGLAEVFVNRVMRGYWSQQKDISDIDWLQSIAAEIGLDPAAMAAATADAEYKKRLISNLDTAVAAGVFGLPASVVDHRIFWGNDRLDLLRHYLSAKEPHLLS